MDFAWYLRRLRRMSIAEIGWRARAAFIQQAWRFGTPRGPAVGSIAWTGAPPPAADADPAARQRLLHCAEEILAGRWKVFGHPFDTAAADPDWHRDIRTGLRSDPAQYCFAVPYRDPAQVGTVKYVWEPSRLHHVTLLAAAYRLSGDARFAEHAASHLKSWWRRNPPLRGIHWLSGIELGMRLIAFVWSRRLLGDWPGVAALFERNPDFLLQLHHHERWLATLHSRGSSANNHLIAEAAGLFIAATAFSGTPQQERWAVLAAGILEQEALTQTFADGLNRELAFDYHGYVLGLLLLAAIEGEADDRPLPDDCWHALTRMADALAANLAVDSAGALQAPRQGDGDDAVALLVDAPEVGPWSPLLALASAVLGPRDWWPRPAGGFILDHVVAPLARKRRGLDLRPATRPDAFKEAGVTFLRTEDDAVSVRVDHGPHGFLSTAAHGHADALAFALSIGGRPVLIDPGTYCYQGETEWRRYFRSTLAHNTLEIAGTDQAVQAGPFLWSTQPTSWVEAMSGIDGGDQAELTVAHDGYRRLAAKATHFRRFQLNRRTLDLAITDWIDAATALPVRLALHLHPAITVTLEGQRARLRWTGGAAVIELPENLSWAVHQGAEHPPLGWFSPEFGEKMPTTVLIGSGEMSPGERLETRLVIGAVEAPAEGHGLKELSA
ncbi:heparinase II/III family protein [Dongia sedimenti]|uniref:Alginate lyase family protein n=1 Tax=Dongia sedimenti TaxID=3064282 RepID=A0ABU0YM19_9PROT|nr:alginate lyase family protein [Rhodospirillaceae bacterium R-7]